MTNDDEGQYWAEMQAEAAAHEAEQAAADAAEYEQEMERQKSIGEMTDKRCPECGCRLLENQKGDLWCSFVGGNKEPACGYHSKVAGKKVLWTGWAMVNNDGTITQDSPILDTEPWKTGKYVRVSIVEVPE